MRLQRLWMPLQSRPPCPFVRRMAMLCLWAGTVGLSSPNSLTPRCPYRSHSPHLFCVVWRGAQKLHSLLFTTVKITFLQCLLWNWEAFPPPPHLHATQRLWSTATVHQYPSLREWETGERWRTMKRKSQWMVPWIVKVIRHRKDLKKPIEVCIHLDFNINLFYMHL